MIYTSGEALSTSLLPAEIDQNWLYPDIRRIRDVSVVVTRGVIRTAQKDGVDRELALRNISDEELEDYIRARMYDPFNEHELVEGEIRELVCSSLFFQHLDHLLFIGGNDVFWWKWRDADERP